MLFSQKIIKTVNTVFSLLSFAQLGEAIKKKTSSKAIAEFYDGSLLNHDTWKTTGSFVSGSDLKNHHMQTY